MRNHKSKGANEKSEKILDYISANSEQGVTIKDVAIAFNMPPETVRHYVKALFDNGYIDRRQQGYGSTHRYFWKKPEDQTQNTMEDTDKEAMDGVERDPDTIIKCGDFCKPGDVVECSSRSGEGLFFKYLVITPWARKAMVIGIFAEGHPNIDLNSPDQIYIGDDPETGGKLYVDLTNVCQRGYKHFGKRLFHADKERMDDVKNRLCRVMQLDSIRSCADSEVARLEYIIKKQKELTVKAVDEKKDLEDELETAKRELKIQCSNYEEEIKDLRQTLQVATGAAGDFEARYTAQKKIIEKLNLDNKKLNEDLAGGDYLNYKERVEQLEADNRVLKNENEEFRQQIIEFSHGKEPIDPDYVDGLENRYGDALLKLKEAQTKVDCYSAQIEFMRQVIFKALNNKGGN